MLSEITTIVKIIGDACAFIYPACVGARRALELVVFIYPACVGARRALVLVS